MNHVAYRELWKAKRGKKHATVLVMLNGDRQIVGHPSIAPDAVLARLERDGLVFKHLLPAEGSKKSAGRVVAPAYQG